MIYVEKNVECFVELLEAIVTVPKVSGGALVRWCDSKEPRQRGAALPEGVKVGAAALDAMKQSGEALTKIEGLDRILGAQLDGVDAGAQAKRHGFTIRSRKFREVRRRA